MQRIHYSGASLLTGDEIAQGIVTYAHALVRVGESAEVHLPVRLADGGTAHAMLLIGPSSELMTIDEESPFDELLAPELLDEWREAITRMA